MGARLLHAGRAARPAAPDDTAPRPRPVPGRPRRQLTADGLRQDVVAVLGDVLPCERAGRFVAALRHLLAERDPVLHVHGEDVAVLAEAVARRLGLPPAAVEDVRRAAELHDVGKVAVPDTILHKPGPLTPQERRCMEQHTVIGERILAGTPALEGVARMVRASHERWDGGGYPDALAGEAIPLGARIVAACDAYDAMTTTRPYHRAIPHDAALAELRRCAGTQFDPRVVEVLAELGPSRAQPRSASSRSLSST